MLVVVRIRGTVVDRLRHLLRFQEQKKWARGLDVSFRWRSELSDLTTNETLAVNPTEAPGLMGLTSRTGKTATCRRDTEGPRLQTSAI